jgi:hypothetical protein
MKIRLFCLHTLLVVLFALSNALAQDTASVTGTVTDPSGATVANAQVTVSNAERGINRTTTTNSDGEYSVPAIPSGSYNVSVTATGFKRFEAKGVILRVAQKTRVDVALQVGASTTEVTVEGTNVAQVETQSSDLAGTVTGKQITQLQLNGRNFTQLITLVPGVSNQTGQDEGAVGIGGSVSYSINGGRTEYNNWELDGGDNMDNGSNGTLNVYPSLEAIAEFRVLTSNYGAQYGRNGSGTIEVETKSGTRAFHGSVYEFARNDAFNAKGYFQRSIPAYKKNDFGYTIGGPVFIPGVYNKNREKTFFFWSQEWRRDRVPGQDFNQLVPSLEERTGNFNSRCPEFSPGLNFVRDDFPDCPAAGPGSAAGTLAPFPNNQVPFDTNDPNVQALLPMISLPNEGSGADSRFRSSPTQPTNWREELIRVDHNFTNNVRGTFRYIHDSWDTITSVPLWTNGGSFPTSQTNFSGPGVSLVTRLTATISPTLLNEFVFSYTADHIVLKNVGVWQRPSTMTMTGIFNNGFAGTLPGINLISAGAYDGGFAQDLGYIPNGLYNSNPTYTFRDNVNKIIGKHNLQFGFYFVAAQKNELGGELGAGSVPGFLTFDHSNGSISTGNPLADLLLGNISSFGQQNAQAKYYNRYKLFEPYFQDDWRVTNKLTLNLGLRLSLYGTYRERYKQAFNFDPAAYVVGDTTVNLDGSVSGNRFNGLVQCGVGGVPSGCMKGHLFNPAPRIGFAYDPFGDGKWAIRGGYGVFFEHANGNEANTESLENSPPLVQASTQNNIFGYTNIGSSGDTIQNFPLSVVSVPTKAVWPYMQQWHLDVQHDIFKNTVATVSYVGSKGTHLGRQYNLNQLFPVSPSANPYAIEGEAIGSPDCDSFVKDEFGVPTDAKTPSGQTIQYGGPGVMSPAVNFGVAACGTVADLFRPFPGYSDITKLENKASSVYHAFQTSVRRSVGALQLSFAYTWSHSIDDSSDRFDSSFVNSYDLAANRASSNFDQRHLFTFSYVYDLPFFRSTPGLTRTLLGGWQLSGITTIQSGTPFSVTYSVDNAGVSNGVGSSSRADLVGNPRSGIVQPPPSDGLGPLWYNPDAFVPPIGLTFGNSPRNNLRNPRRTNFDMALFKHFVIKESMAFEFRAEAFNIFNHTQWGNIGGDAGSAGGAGNTVQDSDNFLFITGAHNPRILQLGAKFVF